MKTFMLIDLVERLSQTNVIIGLVLAALGLALSFLAKRIASVAHKTDEVSDDDKIFLGIKAFGLVMILVALIILVIE